MLRRLFGTRRESDERDPGELLQRILLGAKEAMWNDDASRLEKVWRQLDQEARAVGADRVVLALSTVDAAILLGSDALGPDALTTLDLEVARFTARGDPREMHRYLLQGLARRMAYLTRSGDMRGAYDVLKEIRASVAELAVSDPIRLAAEALFRPENSGERRGSALEQLWLALFGDSGRSD